MNSPDLVPAGPDLSAPTPAIDVRAVLPLVAVGATMLWVVWGSHQPGSWNLVILITALSAHGATLVTSRTASPWSMPAALTVAGVSLALVAVLPLHHSRDLFLYDIYGRAVVTHHANPYFTTPAELGDSVLRFVAEPWHGQESMYGPAFIGLSSVLGAVAGSSELFIRLVWQSVMASAAFGAVVLVARRTKDPRAVLALGCSPILLAAVNDAHNDVLIGLGLLGVVLLVERRRWAWAGVVAALIVATKLSVALPLMALIAWVAWRRGIRPAVRLTTPIVGIVTAAYLFVGGRSALIPLHDSAGDDSRFALWQTLRNDHFEQLSAIGVSRQVVLDTVRDQMSFYAFALLAVCVLIAWWRCRRAQDPGEVVTIVTVIMMITSTYVMPWYPAMILPVAALAWRSRSSILVQIQAAFLLVAYANGPGLDPTTGFGQLLERRAVWINIALLALALVWARPTTLTVDERTDLSPDGPVDSRGTLRLRRR